MTDDRPSSRSFVLRITREEWFRQVFTIKRYYPGVPRRWEPGNTIFLARKADKGDSLVGYGVVERFVRKDLLPEESRLECEKMGWKGELVFGELYRFDPPIPIKETVIEGLGVRGKYLHGYRLTEVEVESILETAGERTAFSRID